MNDPRQTVIYCFSGTGNSLHAAKLLAANIPNASVRPITPQVPSEKAQGIRLGFVFPSYYGQLPRLVRSFVEGLDIAPDTYCFAVVTKGGMGAGTVTVLAELLRQRGRRLSYGGVVWMPGNYIMSYDPDPLRLARKTAKIDRKILSIAGDILREETNRTKRFKFTANKLYTDIPSLDAEFFAADRCNACGTCQQLCPVDNIEIRDGRPVWLHRCEHCTACIQWCPPRAIEYGPKTAKWKRYHHPSIKLADMIKLKEVSSCQK